MEKYLTPIYDTASEPILLEYVNSKKFFIDVSVNRNGFTESIVHTIDVNSELNDSIIISNNQLKIDIGKQLRSLGYFNGLFNIKYKFYVILNDELSVVDVAANRTEIKLKNEITESLTYSNEFVVYNDDELLIINHTTVNSFDYIKLISGISQTLVKNSKIKIIKKIFEDYEDTISIISNTSTNQFDNINVLRVPSSTSIAVPIINSKPYNYDDLVSINEEDVYKYISSVISLDSPDGIKLNIDYSSYDKFIKYGSAVGKISAFRNKVIAIEKYTTKLNEVDNVSSSIDTTYRNKLINDIIDVKNTFDGFERYSYFESGSNTIDDELTEWPALTWPKSNDTYPYELSSSSSTIVKNWFDEIYQWAIDYDTNNRNNFINAIPLLIKMDKNNNKFIAMYSMLGNYFDIVYLYISNITQLKNFNYTNKSGIAFDLLLEMLNNYNFKIKNSYSIKTIKQYLYETSS